MAWRRAEGFQHPVRPCSRSHSPLSSEAQLLVRYFACFIACTSCFKPEWSQMLQKPLLCGGMGDLFFSPSVLGQATSTLTSFIYEDSGPEIQRLKYHQLQRLDTSLSQDPLWVWLASCCSCVPSNDHCCGLAPAYNCSFSSLSKSVQTLHPHTPSLPVPAWVVLFPFKLI